MKKLIFLMLSMLLSGMVLISCTNKVSKISAPCIIDEDKLTLDFKPDTAIAGGNHTYFTTDSSLQDIKDSIDAMSLKKATLTSQIYGTDFLLISKTTADGKLHYYMVAKTAENQAYSFFCPASDLATGYRVLTPFHLLGFSAQSLEAGELYNAEADIAYKISSSQDEIAAFYSSIDIYEVTQESDCITIRIKEDAYISNGPAKHSRGAFAIEFELISDGILATYRTIES